MLSRQVNFETIHAHEVVAERYGTIGELRAELAGGAHGPLAHTELRDWLRALASLRRRRSSNAALLAAHEPPDVRAVEQRRRRAAATPPNAITGHG